MMCCLWAYTAVTKLNQMHIDPLNTQVAADKSGAQVTAPAGTAVNATKAGATVSAPGTQVNKLPAPALSCFPSVPQLEMLG